MQLMLNSENVDSSELSRFESQSRDWWNRNGDFRSLHDINPVRVQYINERATLKGKTVLDIGCGGGILSEAMASLGASVTGIDRGKAAVAAARCHLCTTGLQVTYLELTAENMAMSNPAAFDVITCLELLEHVPDPLSVIQACRTLVKPGGDIFFSTLNRTPQAFLLAIVGAEYVLRLIPRGTHTYCRFIKPVEMIRWLQQAKLIHCETTGMHYHPFSQSCSLGGNLHINYLVHARRG